MLRFPPAVAPSVHRISESVYCIQRRAYLSCSYPVARPEGVALVDAGIDGQGRDAFVGLAAVGRKVSDVRAILLTHWHNDHAAVRREVAAPRRWPLVGC